MSTELNLEDIQEKLIKEHKHRLSDDDPILMMVTINNEMLQAYDELFKTHNTAMVVSLGKQLEAYSAEIEKQTERLLSEAVRSNITNSIEEITAHKSEMRSFLSEIRKYTAIMVSCTLLFVVIALVFAFFWGRA